MQRTENKLTPNKAKQVNAKTKRGLENLTEHRKCHNENRKREDKYRISSPRASGGGACSGPTFASGGLGWILRFPGLVHVVKQLVLTLDRAEEELTWSAMGSWWQLNIERRKRRKSSRRTENSNNHDLNETAEFIPAERKASWSLQAFTTTGNANGIHQI